MTVYEIKNVFWRPFATFDRQARGEMKPLMMLIYNLLEKKEDGVTDGTRTRNIQNHNLGLYH